MCNLLKRHALLLTIGYALFAIAAHAQQSPFTMNPSGPLVSNPLVTFQPNWYFAQWQCADNTPLVPINVGAGYSVLTFPSPMTSNNLNGICNNGQPVKPAGLYELTEYVRYGLINDPSTGAINAPYWSASMRYNAANPAPNGYKPFVNYGGPISGGIDAVAVSGTDNAANIGYIFNAADLPGGSSGEQAMITATEFPGNYNNYVAYFNAMNCGDAGVASGGAPDNSKLHVRSNGQWGDYPLSYDGMIANQVYAFPSWSADITLGSQGGSPNATTGAPAVTYCTHGSFTGPSREKWGFFVRPLQLYNGPSKPTATISLYLIQWGFGATIATATQAEVIVYDYLLGMGRFESWCQADQYNNCEAPNTTNLSVPFGPSCPQITMFPNNAPDPWLDNSGTWPVTAGFHWQMITCEDFNHIVAWNNGPNVPNGWNPSTFFSGWSASNPGGGHLSMPGDAPSPFLPPPE